MLKAKLYMYTTMRVHVHVCDSVLSLAIVAVLNLSCDCHGF